MTKAVALQTPGCLRVARGEREDVGNIAGVSSLSSPPLLQIKVRGDVWCCDQELPSTCVTMFDDLFKNLAVFAGPTGASAEFQSSKAASRMLLPSPATPTSSPLVALSPARNSLPILHL